MSVTGDYSFRPEERPTFAGSPAAPAHPLGRRLGYAAVAVLVGVASTLGNALVNVNLANLSGALGIYIDQASWLPALYVAFNASANLTLVKARAQFGIPAVTCTLLVAYALAGLLQFIHPGFTAAVIIRAVSGMTAAGLTTMTVYNLLQVFPGRFRPLALITGIGLTQLGTPLARLVPVEMLALHQWQGLHLMEIGIALAVLAAITALPLPPSERAPAFQPLDFLVIGLMLPCLVMVCGVLGQGRLLWWVDTPWLGWALAAAVPLFTLAWLIERRRERPLVQVRWLTSLDMARFAAAALLARVSLAEQTYGAVGLLTAGGLINDQLRPLFALVVLSMVGGIAAAALTASERRLPFQVITACLAIAAGAWLDSDATNLVRPPQLYLSQMLLGFGTTLFIGPALVLGLARMLAKGPDHLVTFLVLFSITQNVGGLAGSALLGSLQVASTHWHSQSLSEHLVASDPQVVARLAASGGGALGQALGREAAVLAFNDVFLFVAGLALLNALYVGYVTLFNTLRRRRGS
ncbi:MFS transporter [Nitrospirillum sp. BR 11163]|uniref:MFS transporter n=1 Tax=Nitrospirillum sp. BR 11163 TaxID=3104323 RepID=UPI002AFE4EFB|nr:MFS transporter [Nitrospirillum sp. BR 11163]MEA1674764.1 MFS transporter [Nitrospirillum sp. BR 11163]